MPVSFTIFGSFTEALLLAVGVVSAIKWMVTKASRHKAFSEW